MRSTYKPVAIALAVGLVAAFAAGCGSAGSSDSKPGSTTGTSGSKPASIASAQKSAGAKIAILSNIANGFNACKDRDMAQALSAAGYRPTAYYSNLDPSKLTQNIQDALTKGTKGAIYVSHDPKLDQVAINKLTGAGVKTVFNLGPPVTGASPAVTMPADFAKAGKVAVDELLKLRPDIKRVGLIPGTAGHPSSDLTDKGWVNQLAKNGIKPVATIHGDLTPPGGTRVAQDMLQAHPDLQALLVIGDDMALAAARVVQTSGSHAVVVDTFGYSKAAMQAVRSGKLLALSYSDVPRWAGQIASAMVGVMQGKSQPKLVTLEPRGVDKSNVGTVTAC
jgi:ribose transport system substrate-binding protein